MEKVFTYSIISVIIAVAVPFFQRGRNFNYLLLAVVFAGGVIALWANSNSKIGFEDYHRVEISIERAEFDNEEERLLIFAEGERLLLPSQNLASSDVEIIREAALGLAGPATIWIRPSNNTITGIATSNLNIDPIVVAKKEVSAFLRLRNVGIGISGFGLLLMLFYYLVEPSNQNDLTLTQKY